AGQEDASLHSAAVLIPAARDCRIDRNHLAISPPIETQFGLDRRLDDEVDIGNPRIVNVCMRDVLAAVAPHLQSLVVVENKSTHDTGPQRIFRNGKRFEPIAKMTRNVIEDAKYLGLSESVRTDGFEQVVALIWIERTELAAQHALVIAD